MNECGIIRNYLRCRIYLPPGTQVHKNYCEGKTVRNKILGRYKNIKGFQRYG